MLQFPQGPPDHVSIKNAESEEDVIANLVTEGYLCVDARREKRLAKMVAELNKAQDNAKRLRVGDFSISFFCESCESIRSKGSRSVTVGSVK